ncbi:flavin reductase family protein [Streptomyces sp. NPDC102441]|uniref:flavin reductase family protein n=1 Tax=Streptomyces sp. NPDC102441 TaxID=3366176 RepID=UPI0037FA3EA0
MSEQESPARGIEPVTAPEQLRRAFGYFPSGAAALCAQLDGEPMGLAASSFASVSTQPPLVAAYLPLTSTSWPALRRRPRLGVSVLAEDQEEIRARLASEKGDRFAGTDWFTGRGGGVFLKGATVWLDCSIYEEVTYGDHVMVLLYVNGLSVAPDTSPLVVHTDNPRRPAGT